MNRILVINGHPDSNSFSASLTEAYLAGLRQHPDVAVTALNIRDLEYSPVLQHGYQKRTDHEPDLARIMDLFKQADHTVFIYPTWWGSLPAQLKGLIDRVFLPGHFFDYKPGAVFQTKLMKGKTARVITTMDMPLWFERLTYKRPGYNIMKKLTLEYCGYKVKWSAIGGMKFRKEEELQKILQKATKWGLRDAQRTAGRMPATQNVPLPTT